MNDPNEVNVTVVVTVVTVVTTVPPPETVWVVVFARSEPVAYRVPNISPAPTTIPTKSSPAVAVALEALLDFNGFYGGQLANNVLWSSRQVFAPSNEMKARSIVMQLSATDLGFLELAIAKAIQQMPSFVVL